MISVYIKECNGAKMRILVTGGSGFVGRNLVRSLISLGHDVTITSMGAEPDLPGVSKTLYLGLTGIDERYLKNQDAVIHLMANNDTLCQDQSEVFRANVYGPRRLFSELYKGGCRQFIYASSTAVYGSSPAPYIESTTPIEPLNVYAQSKAIFDEFAMAFGQEHGVKTIGLRYCNIYGPGEEDKGRRMSMIGQIIRTAMKREMIELFEYGEQLRDWVYINDVVDANLLALDSSNTSSEIYNIGSGKASTFNDIIYEVGLALKTRIGLKYIPCPFSSSYQNHTECDISKAKRELGYEPKFSLKFGIESYCKNLVA